MLGTLAIVALFLLGTPALAGDRLDRVSPRQAAVGTPVPVAPELPPAVPGTLSARAPQQSRLISRYDRQALAVGFQYRFVVLLPEASLYEAPRLVPRAPKATPNSLRGPPSFSR